MFNHCSEMEHTEYATVWLSIIIPVYNAERFLEKCLHSIEMQSDRNFEVLLIDDGSTDSSSVICRRYADKDSRFHYIKKENGGAYQARIFGAEQSKGTYITFCDADDFYSTRHAFKILHNHLLSGQYDAVQFSHENIYNHLKQKKRCVRSMVSVDREGFLSNEYPRLLCSFWDNATLTTNVWNKVYHRRLLSNFPASDSAERIFWGDDLIMNLHLLSTCHSLLFIPDILYSYRQSSGGTCKFHVNILNDLDNIKKYQLLYLERYQGEAVQKIRSILFSELSCWFFEHIQQAIQYMSEAEIETMISAALALPRFVLARNYYLYESDCNWIAMELLRKADPKQYITDGKICVNRRTVKRRVKSFLMKIYASI